MKKTLMINLTILTVVLMACGGQTVLTQTTPNSATLVPALLTQVPGSTDTSASTNSTSVATEVTTGSVSFANDVMPIFKASCFDCHGVKQIKAGNQSRTGLENIRYYSWGFIQSSCCDPGRFRGQLTYPATGQRENAQARRQAYR